MHGPAPKRASPRALAAEEKKAVLDVLHEPRFVDLAPAEVYATLLDEGRYLCCERTMYRVLAENAEVRERRDQLRHPKYAAPELLATRPNQLWSWDITKLLGPAKWTYFYLYVILDVFSRYVVGWMVADAESAALAEQLIAETCERQGIGRGQLTIHADRGSSMKSKPVAMLLADLGVTKTHSRPHVSNDNPYSRGAVQDAEVPAGLPRALRVRRGRAWIPRRLLPLVQQRAPPHRPRAADAGRCALRPRRATACRAEPSSSKPLTAPTPSASCSAAPVPPPLPIAAWINKPKSADGSVIARA